MISETVASSVLMAVAVACTVTDSTTLPTLSVTSLRTTWLISTWMPASLHHLEPGLLDRQIIVADGHELEVIVSLLGGDRRCRYRACRY